MSQEPTRRDILGLGACLGVSLASGQARGEGGAAPAGGAIDDPTAPDREEGRKSAEERRASAASRRRATADFYLSVDPERQRDNGDEHRYEDQHFYASYTKGLEHDGFGEVVVESYRSLLTALKSGKPADFDGILLGCIPIDQVAAAKPLARVAIEAKPGMDNPKQVSDDLRAAQGQRVSPENVAADNQVLLTDPQAGLAYDLVGIDSHQLALPPAYSFRSKGEIGEIAENYWLALARDVPFASYDTDPTTVAAAKDLSRYAIFDGPRNPVDGKDVTTGVLFRGFTSGDAVGPYLSQFLIRDIPYGSQMVKAELNFGLPDTNYMTKADTWLAVQRGCKQPGVPMPYATPRRIYRGRDLAQYVHIDELFQAYFNACLLLITPLVRNGFGGFIEPGIPYTLVDPATNTKRRTSTQTGFGTLGEPNFKVLVAAVATLALKAAWYQKWFVHRRLRPEVYAGRIHFNKTAARQYEFDEPEYKKLDADLFPRLLDSNRKTNGDNLASYLLPMAFPEGSPTHPAYGAGHATVAGACVTVLKAIFYEESTLTGLGVVPMIPRADGSGLDPYTGADKDQLTVGGELNKLAANIGLARNFAGVHWRSDYTESLHMGEKVALYYLQDYVRTYNEAPLTFNVTRFGGRKVQITKGAQPQVF